MSNFDDPNPNRAPWIDDAGRRSPAELASPYDASDPSGRPPEPTRKSGLGCWFWGCLGSIVFMLLMMIGIGFGTYWFISSQVTKYTDTQPAEMPVVDMPEEEVEALKARIDRFTSQVQSDPDASPAVTPNEDDPSDATDPTTADDPTDPDSVAPATEPMTELVLTADEINALIASQPEMRGRMYVQIEDGRVFGKVSIPTDMIPGGKGRFFNADAEFDVSLVDGILEVRLIDASVKGERIPQSALEGLAQENLAKDAYNDPENAKILRKFEKIEVLEDSIVLKLKESAIEPQPTSEPDAPAEPEPKPEPEPKAETETETVPSDVVSEA